MRVCTSLADHLEMNDIFNAMRQRLPLFIVEYFPGGVGALGSRPQPRRRKRSAVPSAPF
jgi:hypothetical protein